MLDIIDSFSSRDIGSLTRQFEEFGKVRLTDFLASDSAVTMAHAITGLRDFYRAFVVDDRPTLISENSFSEAPQPQRDQLISDVYSKAASGVGYWYSRYSAPADCQVHSSIAQWLNSEAVLSAVQKISNTDALTRASFQITRFLPGDFLTRHSDRIVEEQRQLAFVLNLSPRWHPDWGGLLQFFTAQGAPVEAWVPEFNSFGLFSVEHIHSVTSVAGFAGEPRLTISGWFHSG